MKKEDTAKRISQRRYEERNKEVRKAKSGTFSTYMPREEVEEINDFLKTYNITKVDLIRLGFDTLKRQIKGNN